MTDRTLTVEAETHSSGVTVLTVTGELDHHTAPRLTHALENTPFARDSGTVLDLSGLSYCDSTGITVLITAYHRAQATGSNLFLAGVSSDLMRVFRIVGLDQVLSFQPNVDSAVAALRL
ncbi:STAS domain-containing protein [Streptomyces tropicalis]|uniref:Anti-sigma factor antagonist n=1 Tax=Streptomyces tropicalis TaxID=3034234 RepID=A0ABT6A5J4_9ACTN|nr:STAS domain-containing protein [Streptomyces tropicalis]MDF3299090.1 STAS domain-containing protein [Streptomyces tropicalis]